MPTFLTLSALLLAAVSAGAAEPAGVRAWPAEPLTQVLRSALPPENPPAAVQMDACRGDVENGEVAYRAGKDVARLTAAAPPLRGAGGAMLPAPRVRFVGYVPIRKNTEPHLSETGPQVLVAEAPVDLPDPLLEDSAVAAKAGETGAVWLTLSVPRDARPGLYQGSVTLSADGEERRMPLRVRVWPAVLPAAMTLKVVNWYYPVVLTHTYGCQWWDDRFWQLVEADARGMAAHRQSVGHIILNETIEAVEGAGGAVTFDFSHFDRMAETYQKAGLPYLMGSALAGRHEWASTDFYAIPLPLRKADGTRGVFPAPEAPASADEAKKRVFVKSDAFEKYLAAFLPAFQKHLEEKGWADCYLQLQADEPLDSNADAYARLGGLVRKYAPKLRRVEANRSGPRIAGALDIWAPLLDDLDHRGAFYRQRQQAGDELWFYTCERPRGRYLNRMIDYPLIKTRLLHWANFLTGTTGYLHWGFNPMWGNPFQNPGTPPGDGHLVYPGVARLHGAPAAEDKLHSLDSIRYEAMRDGIEDYELLRLLAAKEPQQADAICRQVMRSLTDYTLDPQQVAAARRELLQALSKGQK